MKKQVLKVALAATLATLSPLLSRAQGMADDLHSLQGVLQQMYNQMLPLCSGLIGIGRGIGAFAALFYIGTRVWKHLAAAEPVEVYPLLRPFAIGFCIVIFPSVLAVMNGLLQPVVTATQGMVNNTNAAISRLTEDQPPQDEDGDTDELSSGDSDKYYQYSHPDGSGDSGNPISSAFSGWSIKNYARKFIAEVLNVLFQAAALCLDTIRTFKLIVLAILGPLCFGLSIFDGFQHTLKQWIARYVNVFMWLPVANIFGAIIAKIQENMIIAAQTGNLPGNWVGNESTGYLIFLLIGIVGYFTVPSIANYIMNVGGHALFSKASALSAAAYSTISSVITQGIYNGGKPNSGGPESPMKDKLSGSKNKS